MKVQISNLRNIESLTMEIPDGKVSFLIGASGSGKSTIAAALNNHLSDSDVRAGLDYASMSVKRTPDDLKAKIFDIEMENRLYAEELSSGVYEIVLANDDEYETAKRQFERSIDSIKSYEEELIARREAIKGLIDSTKSKINRNGEFSKASMIGALKAALANSPQERIDLIKQHGGEYLKWLMTGVGFPEWKGKKVCPFCLSEDVPIERSEYLDKVTDTTETKGFSNLPAIESSLRSAEINFGDLLDINELDAAGKQIKSLLSELKSIEFLVRLLNSSHIDPRQENDLIDSIDPSNDAYQHFPNLPQAIDNMKKTSAGARKAFGILRSSFQKTVSNNLRQINAYLKNFDIPYKFTVNSINMASREAQFYLIHQDSKEEIDYRSKLSYGEKNVIALVLFLLQPHEHELIIIDDPVSSYDEYRREQVYRLIIEQPWSNTVLLLSHDHVFAKYALYHYKKSKQQQRAQRSLSRTDQRVIDRTGSILFLTNNMGTTQVGNIDVGDYDTVSNHIRNRLSNPTLTYYQKVINLRLLYECERQEKNDSQDYGYLSAILHAPKAESLASHQAYVRKLLSDEGVSESTLLRHIESKTNISLPLFDRVSEADFETTEDFLPIEIIAAARELEGNADVRAEMSDIIHMNAALVYCLNPYKHHSCSKRLQKAISLFSSNHP